MKVKELKKKKAKVKSGSFFEEVPVVESVSFMNMNISRPILKVRVICVEYIEVY